MPKESIAAREIRLYRESLPEYRPTKKPYRKQIPKITIESKYQNLIRRARKSKIMVTISQSQYEELLKTPICHYCSATITSGGSSLDRIDPTGHYTLSNVLPCCGSCNKIKNSSLTYDEMKIAMSAIIEYRKSHLK